MAPACSRWGCARWPDRFEAGDCVELAGPDGSPFARGISAYPAAELRGLVGRKGIDEAVHRDNLVLL